MEVIFVALVLLCGREGFLAVGFDSIMVLCMRWLAFQASSMYYIEFQSVRCRGFSSYLNWMWLIGFLEWEGDFIVGI